MRLPYLVLALAALSSTACINSARSDQAIAAARGPAYDRDLLSAEEIGPRSTTDMYDTVLALRPFWLRPAGGGRGASAPVIYLDGRRVGSAEVLKQIRAPAVERARYYTLTQAQNRFGKIAVAPAIDITMKAYPEE